MNEKDKSTTAIIAAVLVIVVGAALFFILQGPKAPQTNENTSTTQTDTATSSSDTQPQGAPRRQPQTAQAYQQAVADYEGERIQFENCLSLLSNYTFKSGTRIMLDGKSPDPQTISIGTRTYVLNGYDYKFATLPTVKAPTTIYLNCETQGETQYSIAKILVQQ